MLILLIYPNISNDVCLYLVIQSVFQKDKKREFMESHFVTKLVLIVGTIIIPHESTCNSIVIIILHFNLICFHSTWKISSFFFLDCKGLGATYYSFSLSFFGTTPTPSLVLVLLLCGFLAISKEFPYLQCAICRWMALWFRELWWLTIIFTSEPLQRN